jgi:hypothetical protein
LILVFWSIGIFSLKHLELRRGGAESFLQLCEILNHDPISLIAFLNLHIGCTADELKQVARLGKRWKEVLNEISNPQLKNSLNSWYKENLDTICLQSVSTKERTAKKQKTELVFSKKKSLIICN